MISFLSVILPTYNPDVSILQRTIIALEKQTLPQNNWELIVVDNNSSSPFGHAITLPKNAKIIFEENQGLTFARVKGFKECKGSIIVMVDDDNILDKYYLENCISIFSKHPNMGAIGGNIEGDFTTPPPAWAKNFFSLLAVRNLGDEILITNQKQGEDMKIYPLFSPVGAGMAIRAEALYGYLIEVDQSKYQIADRSADNLASSGDNEIVMQIILSGYDIGFFPALKMKHVIPTQRLNKSYLGKLNRGIMYSWTFFLIKYKQCPWKRFHKITLTLRTIKAFVKYRPWRSPTNYIKYNGVIGQLQALTNR